jgi:uncharacterized oxidoreductase
MRTFTAGQLEDVATAIFQAVGSPDQEARLVAHELVVADLMGLRSHGVIRIPSYVKYVTDGEIRPGAAAQLLVETDTTAVLDCSANFGQVGAMRALAIATAKARASGLGAVVTRRCHHVGRLGSYPERAARDGLICLATATTRRRGHFVVPWGGREGRLGTNPVAYGVPTSSEPVVADFATSVIPEGTVRVAIDRETMLPEGAAIDAGGRPTRDPHAFYGPPMGALLPFGGSVGYKGYAMGLLAEILAGTLAGEHADDDTRPANGFFVLVIDPTAFLPSGSFPEVAGRVVDYVRSSPPAAGSAGVLMPGERETVTRIRTDREGIGVEDATWDRIEGEARRLGVDTLALTAR